MPELRIRKFLARLFVLALQRLRGGLDTMIPYFSAEGEFLGSINEGDSCPHQDAKPTGETCFMGCCDYYLCPHCGKRFLVELPD